MGVDARTSARTRSLRGLLCEHRPCVEAFWNSCGPGRRDGIARTLWMRDKPDYCNASCYFMGNWSHNLIASQSRSTLCGSRDDLRTVSSINQLSIDLQCAVTNPVRNGCSEEGACRRSNDLHDWHIFRRENYDLQRSSDTDAPETPSLPEDFTTRLFRALPLRYPSMKQNKSECRAGMGCQGGNTTCVKINYNLRIPLAVMAIAPVKCVHVGDQAAEF